MPPDFSLVPFFHASGYEAPPTLSPPLPSPALDIGGQEEGNPFEIESLSLAFPLHLSLRVRLQGVPVNLPSPIIQAIVEEDTLTLLSLYTHTPPSQPWAVQAHHQAVQVIYTGEGFVLEKDRWLPFLPDAHTLNLSAGDLLYQKLFAYEKKEKVIERWHRLSDGQLERTPPGTTKRLFRPFGGRLNPSTQTAEQIYYEISESYPFQTTFTLYTASQIPQEGVLLEPPPTPEEGRSLAQAIQQGLLSVKMTASSSSEEQTYQSYALHKQNPDSLDILFSLNPMKESIA